MSDFYSLFNLLVATFVDLIGHDFQIYHNTLFVLPKFCLSIVCNLS